MMQLLTPAAIAGAAIGLTMAVGQILVARALIRRAIDQETEAEGPSPDEPEFQKRLATIRRMVWSSLVVLPLAGFALGVAVSRGL